MKRWNPFENIDIQWFADPPAPPPPGTPPEPNPPGPPATPPPEADLSADGTFLAQAPDKYKKDQKLLKDLLKHKNWGEVLDRLYAGEQKVADLQAKVPGEQLKPEDYEFDEPKFPDFFADEKMKATRDNLAPYLKASQEDMRTVAKELGLSKDAAKRLAVRDVERIFAQFKAAQDDYAKQREKGLTALKEEWKGDFAAHEELARRAITTFDKEKILDALAAEGAENHPGVIKIFYEIGKAIGEGHLVPGKPGPTAPSPEDQKKTAMKKRYPRSPELTGGEPTPAPAVDEAVLDRLKKRFPKQAEGEKL
jgi:hypothetical protein